MHFHEEDNNPEEDEHMHMFNVHGVQRATGCKFIGYGALKNNQP